MTQVGLRSLKRVVQIVPIFFGSVNLEFSNWRWQAPGAVKKEKKIEKKSEKNPKKNQKNRASAYICFCRLRAKSRI